MKMRGCAPAAQVLGAIRTELLGTTLPDNSAQKPANRDSAMGDETNGTHAQVPGPAGRELGQGGSPRVRFTWY